MDNSVAAVLKRRAPLKDKLADVLAMTEWFSVRVEQAVGIADDRVPAALRVVREWVDGELTPGKAPLALSQTCIQKRSLAPSRADPLTYALIWSAYFLAWAMHETLPSTAHTPELRRKHMGSYLRDIHRLIVRGLVQDALAQQSELRASDLRRAFEAELAQVVLRSRTRQSP